MNQDLERSFMDMSLKVKLFYYRKVLRRVQDKDTALSADEAYCVDAIYVLGRPTIGEFAHYVQISPQSAAYKDNNLVRKGFITRTRGNDDKREFFLEVTDKFTEYHETCDEVVGEIADMLREKFSEEDVEKLAAMVAFISNEVSSEDALRS